MNEDLEELKAEIEHLNKKNAILTQAIRQSKTIKEKFNESTKLLKVKDLQLNELNNFLETKVQQRTSELQKVLHREEHLRNILQMTTEVNEMLITAYSTNNIIKECGQRLASNSKYSLVVGGLINEEIFEVIFKSKQNNSIITEHITSLKNSNYVTKAIQKVVTVKNILIEKISVKSDPNYSNRIGDIDNKWLMILPLIDIEKNEVYGVLLIFLAQESGFDSEEVKILENMSHDINHTIYSHKQQNSILAMEKEKISNYEETILAFVNIIEQRDTYTAGHTVRVAEYCSLIASEMGYSGNEIHRLEKAAILHDIGKVATPDTILLKPGKLSVLEYSLIKQHSQTGFDMLNKISIYKDLAEIIKYHHARYDGHGYPKTSNPNEIPMLSHIMIVADSFDAMTTNRIYRPRMSVEEALEEVKNCSLTQFHPVVVKSALVALKNVHIDKTSQMPTSELEQKRMSYFFQDGLTGLYNEDYLKIILNSNVNEYRCLNIINIHNFSSYNQINGWEGGNELLKSFANLLNELYPDSTIIRYHGDDFIILNKIHQEIDIEQLQNNHLIKESQVLLEITHYDTSEDFSFKKFLEQENG